jgi:hypothetical protein
MTTDGEHPANPLAGKRPRGAAAACTHLDPRMPVPSAIASATWKDLLWGPHGVRCLVLSGGVAVHAVSVFVVSTILPLVVRSIGGVEYYAWSSTLYVVASITGSALAADLPSLADSRARPSLRGGSQPRRHRSRSASIRSALPKEGDSNPNPSHSDCRRRTWSSRTHSSSHPHSNPSAAAPRRRPAIAAADRRRASCWG